MTNVARQWIETERLFGVDVVPMPATASASAPATATATATASGAATGSGAGAGAATGAATATGSAAASASAPASAPAPAPASASASASSLSALRDRYLAHVVPTVTQYPFQNAVFGEGADDAAVMFVGEGPGADEDRTGRPFVGRAGEKLDGMIRAMGLERDAVYIANVVKIRPPENRTPLPDEIERDWPYLRDQIRLVRPDVIVTLGAPASKLLLHTDTGIGRLRGQWATYDDAEAGLSIPVMPTFHPAYVLRQYTRDVREKVWSDLQAVMQRLGLAHG